MCKATQFTAKKKRAFIECLAETGNVSQSATVVGVNRITAYKHYRSDLEFAAAWDEAVEVAALALEDEARRRAYEGVDEPVFYKGDECGYIRKYSDTLLIFLLKGIKPEKYKDRQQVTHDFSGLSDAELIAEAKSLLGGVLTPQQNEPATAQPTE